MTIFEDMAAIMAEVTHVGKDDRFDGGGVRYAYRGVDRVVQALGPAMRKRGVIMLPTAAAAPEWIPTVTSKGAPSNVVRVLVTYTLTAQDGTYVSLTVPGEAMDTGDKAVSKAMSVAWRTALIQAFFLPTGEPDPDSQVFDLGTGKPATRAAAAYQRAEQRDAVLAEWRSAIEAAKGDHDAMVGLYNEARVAKAPREIMAEILEAGKKK